MKSICKVQGKNQKSTGKVTEKYWERTRKVWIITANVPGKYQLKYFGKTKTKYLTKNVIIRPDVAGAVLQTPLSFIH